MTVVVGTVLFADADGTGRDIWRLGPQVLADCYGATPATAPRCPCQARAVTGSLLAASTGSINSRSGRRWDTAVSRKARAVNVSCRLLPDVAQSTPLPSRCPIGNPSSSAKCGARLSGNRTRDGCHIRPQVGFAPTACTCSSSKCDSGKRESTRAEQDVHARPR